jgi:hypothetical protein
MGKETPHGVSGDTAPDAGGSASGVVVENFFGKALKLTCESQITRFVPYHNGRNKCLLQFGTPGGGWASEIWVDEDQVSEIITALQGLLIRVAIMRDAAEIEARDGIECDGGPHCQAPEHIHGCFAERRSA